MRRHSETVIHHARKGFARRATRLGLLVALLAGVAYVCLAGSAVRPQVARAAVGPAWNVCNNHGVDFLSQKPGPPGTQLYTETDTGSGANFSPVGPQADFDYNSIGFNTTDNYVYATTNGGGGNSDYQVLKIGRDGVATPVSATTITLGPGSNNGAFDEAGTADAGIYYNIGTVTTPTGPRQALFKVDPSIPSIIGSVPLSASWPAADFSFAGGFLWGLNATDDNGNADGVLRLYRMNVNTGEVDGPFNAGSTLPVIGPAPTKSFGAAWTYGNGNLGFLSNQSGDIFQIHVADPGGANPNPSLVQHIGSPLPSGNLDATACPGPPINLSIAKDGPATVDSGGTITWHLTVHNGGNGDSSGYVVDDDLPAAVTNPQTSTPGCSITGHHLTCNAGALPEGSSDQITITAGAPPAGTCVDNFATVDGHEKDPDLSNNTSNTVHTCVPVHPELTIHKDGPATVARNGTITYTLTVHNAAGADAATSFRVVDHVPAGVTNVASSTPGCSVSGNDVTCSEGTLAANGDFQISVSGNAPNVSNTCVDNNAVVSTTDAETNPNNNTSNTVHTCTPRESDLAIAKSGPATVDAGGTINWQLDVHNNGPDASSGYTVSDTVPAAVTNVQTSTAGCSVAGNTVTCTSSGLANGADALINLSGTAPGTSNTCVTNHASVLGADLDPVGANNTSNDVRTCTPPRADLSITKSIDPGSLDSNGNIVAGTNVGYTLTIANNGPDPSPATSATDQLPAALTYVSDNGNCTRSGQTLSCPIPGLLPGGTHVIHLVTSTAPDATGCVDNGAHVLSVAGVVDPPGNNDADSGSHCFVHKYDLSVTKDIAAGLDTDGNFVAGTDATYLVTVHNAGPSQSSPTSVTDHLPSAVAYVSSPDGCTGTQGQAGATVTCPVGALGPNGSASFHIVVHVLPDAPAGAANGGNCIRNTASVAVSAPDTDLDLTNNSGSTSCPGVDHHADLGLVKASNVDPLIAGTDATYTLTVTNNGPSFSSASRVDDTLPAGLTYVSDDDRCTTAGQAVSCPVPILGLGGTHTIHLTVHVAPSPPPADPRCPNGIRNDASVVEGLGATDPTPGNNAAFVCNGEVFHTDLEMTKSADQSTLSNGHIVAGTDISYDLTITNHGPSDSPAGATASDTLPANLTFLPSPGCSAAGQVVTCTTTAVLDHNGGQAHFVLNVHVSPATPASVPPNCLSNGATANPAPSATDPNSANNGDAVCIQVERHADLKIVKSIDPATTDGGALVPGTDITYILTVTNVGPSDSDAQTITDTLPVQMTYVSDDDMCTNTLGTLTCSIGALTTVAPGNTKTIRITAHLDPSTLAGVCVDNTGKVLPNAPATDPNPGNNSSSTGCPVIKPEWDIKIEKRAENDPVIPGQNESYDVTVTNEGPSTAVGEVVTDDVPNHLSFVSGTNGCALVGGQVSCRVPSLLPLQQQGFGLVMKVDPSAVDPITNTARVTPPGPGVGVCIPASCTAQATIHLTPQAKLVTEKEADTDPVAAGTDETYHIVVTNKGPSTAEDVIVSDPLPPNTTFVSADPACVNSGTDITCTGPGLLPNDQQSYAITVHVLPSATGTVTNTATTTSHTPCFGPCPPPVTKIVHVTQEADMAIVKTPSAPVVTAGGQVTYTLAVVNNGPSDATGVKVVDHAPGALTTVSATPSQGTCDTTEPLTCDLGKMPYQGTAQIVVVAQVAAGQTAPIDNTATVSADPPDPHPDNNTSKAHVVVTQPVGSQPGADIEVTKKVDHAKARLGTPLTYTITVVNHGPANALGAFVTDTPGQPMQLVSATSTAGTCGTKFPVTCMIGTMLPGMTVTIKIVAIPLRVGTAPNTASATSNTFDPDPHNNTDKTSSKLTPSLVLAKVPSRTSASAGQTITYRLKVTNGSNGTVKNVRVCDQLPSGLAYVRSNPTATISQGRPCWTVKRLRSYGSASFEIVAKVLKGASGRLVNRATASVHGLPTVHTRARAVAVKGRKAPLGGVTG